MESLKELVSIGKQYFDNKEYDDAEIFLKKAIKNNGKYADVLNMLGVISHVNGKFASSIECFREALKINPRYTEAILNLTVLYNDLGQYDDAKKLYSSLKKNTTKQGKKIEPVLRGKLSNLHADIGDIYRSIGLHDFAIGEYKKALDLNPTYTDIRTKLGQALREKGDLKTSLSELKKVLKQKPQYCPALIQQGVTLYSMENHTGAKNSWAKVLKKDPQNEYAKMYIRLGEAMNSKTKIPSKTSAKPKKKTKARKKKR